MFFAAFFGALFYARQLSVPWLGGEGVKIFNKLLLWQDFDARWPTNGPGTLGGHADGDVRDHPRLRPAGAQHGHPADLGRHHHRSRTMRCGQASAAILAIFLAATFLLGFLFVYLQAHGVHRGLPATWA